MTSRLFLIFLFLMFVGGSVALADIAQPNQPRHPRTPKPAQSDTVKFTIKSDESLTTPELRVPRSLAGNFDAAGLVVPGQSSAAAGPSATQTMVGGLFLSLAVMFGGLWLVRQRGLATSKPVSAALAVGALGFLTVGALANLAPYPRYLEAGTLPKAVRDGKALSGKAKIVIVEDGDGIVLVVPTKTASGE
jgi:hypothetical protein